MSFYVAWFLVKDFCLPSHLSWRKISIIPNQGPQKA